MSSINTQLPLIMLTGHRKSGTSLFHRLFDGVDGINVYPIDISILYAYFPCFTNNKQMSKTSLEKRLLQVVDKSFDYLEQFNTNLYSNKKKFLNLFKKHIKDINISDKTAVITALHAAWSSFTSQSTNVPFLFKETSQSVYFEDYKKRFPKLKMISIIRDPRDNFAAIQSGVEHYYSKLGEDNLAALSSHINRARMDLLSASINQRNHPQSFLAIRFEDLVNEPRSTMTKVAEFLDIEYSEQLIKPQIAGEAYAGNNHDGKKISGISKQHVGAWQQRISCDTTKIIEYWLSDCMNIWDYPLAYDHAEAQHAFAEFYGHYNCHYFFKDSFAS